MVDFLDGRLRYVWLDQLFPLLGYNDLLRLRRVCKKTKELATSYFFTPGNQRSWELFLRSPEELQDVVQKKLPPPSRLRLHVYPEYEDLFFGNDYLAEFMKTNGKYITYLDLAYIKLPLISAKQLEFYEGLTNLKSLIIRIIHTGGEAAIKKRIDMEGSRLFPQRFRNLKSFQVDVTDDRNLTWRLINGMADNLENLSTPLSIENYALIRDSLPRQFMERQRKITFFDCSKTILRMDSLERLRLFETCFRNGIKMKNVPASALESILVDRDTGLVDRSQVIDPVTGELVYEVNYQRNAFIGNVIHSLWNLSDYVFLTEMLHLEEVEIDIFHNSTFRICRRHRYPSWPNLKKLKVSGNVGIPLVNNMLHFLWGQKERPNLEQLVINLWRNNGMIGTPVLNPMDIGRTCWNLKKLTLNNCKENNAFFVSLWKGLPLLESVHLKNCLRLGNQGFIGAHVNENRPVFMNLQRLKHLKICNVGGMRITDEVFTLVIRHIRLASFELSSTGTLTRRITVNGIKSLLHGVFAESIERLHLSELKISGVSAEEMKELVSLFRSSQMI